VDFPTTTAVRIDTVPSPLPAPIRVTDEEFTYFVEFLTLGNEVAQYTVKTGPAGDTSCEDPDGYRFMFLEFMTVRKTTRPQVLCAMPFDAAGNPGVLFVKVLP
jgi:hypothetical protein